MQAKDLIVLGSSRLLGKLYCNDISIGGSASFASISTTGDIIVGGKINVTGSITAKAGVELYHNTPYIDFHFGNNTADYTSRIIESESGKINISPQLNTPNATITTGHITTIKSGTIENTGDVNVLGTLHAREYELENVADLGGSFVVAPTLIVPNSSSVTGDRYIKVKKVNNTTLTIEVHDPSLSTANIGGFTWNNGYRIKISGTIENVLLGTCSGSITSVNTGSKIMEYSITCAADVITTLNPSTSGTNYQNGHFKLNIMLYNADTSGADSKPIGIYLQSYGTTKNPIIDVWNGASTIPKVRLGYLGGISYNNTNLGTGEWGLYSDNVYLTGSIIANSGKIGGWDIGTDSKKSLFTGNQTPGATTNNLVLSPTSATNSNAIGGSATGLTWFISAGRTFGVTTDGKIYANGGGKLANWNLDSNSLSNGTYGNNNSAMVCTGTSGAKSIGGSPSTTSGWVFTAGDKFGVTKTGDLYCSAIHVNGGLNISGRNMLTRANVLAQTTSYTESNYVYQGLYGNGAGLRFPAALFTEGKTYVLSFKIQKVSGTLNKIGGHQAAFETVWFYVDGVASTNTYSSGATVTNDTNVHTVSVCLKRISSTTSDANLYIQPNRSGYSTGANDNDIKIWDLQLEEGNVQTAWSPAPEDYDAHRYITDITGGGIWVTPPDKKPTNTGAVVANTTTGTKIDGNGLYIYKGGNCVAQYGESVTVGLDSSGHVTIKSDGLHIWKGAESTATNEVAKFGSSIVLYKPGSNTATVTIDSNGATFNGKINATGGFIGQNTTNGFTISNSAIYNPSNKNSISADTVDGIYVGKDGISLGKGLFKITSTGNLTAKSGTIGGWLIDEDKLYKEDVINELQEVNWKTSTYLSPGFLSFDWLQITDEAGATVPANTYYGTTEFNFTNIHFSAQGTGISTQTTNISAGIIETDTVQAHYIDAPMDCALYLQSNDGNNRSYLSATGNFTVEEGAIQSTCTGKESDIICQGPAGRVYMYSANSATGNRGLYGGNKAGTAAPCIVWNQSNEAFIWGSKYNSSTFCHVKVTASTSNGYSYLVPGATTNYRLGSSTTPWDVMFCNDVHYGALTKMSDLKRKSIIDDFDWKVDSFIRGLKPIAYNSIDNDGKIGEKIQFGFGAQDVFKLSSELGYGKTALYYAIYSPNVSNKEDIELEYRGEEIDDNQLSWSLSYSDFIAPMILEIQKLMDRVDKLESEINQLKETKS